MTEHLKTGEEICTVVVDRRCVICWSIVWQYAPRRVLHRQTVFAGQCDRAFGDWVEFRGFEIAAARA